MMNVATLNIFPALPEIIVLSIACIALLAELFIGHRYRYAAYTCVQIGLILAAVITFTQLHAGSVVTFHGLFINDDIARLLKLFIYLSAFAAFFYARQYNEARNIPCGEYYVLGLFSVLGMMVLVSAHSFITIYLGLELLSLPLYAMVALHRDNADATEAALKYFIMGAIASGMMLYGMSMLYGATASLNLSAVATAISATATVQSPIFAFALVFIVAGFGFKLAAAPFHMWAPDVYTGAPTSVTTFLSTAPKVAALGMALRLLIFALPELFIQWQQLLIIMVILSIAIGNLFAIAQANIKRMLAYSAIAHIGYMLLGLVAGTQEGNGAALFYILVYAIMSLAGFAMVVLLSRAGFEAENIDDFKGLNTHNPWLAFLVLLVMFSMAGIPPTVGFFAKLLVIKAVIDVNMIWLATFALLFAVIGAFYYLRIVKTMYFEAPYQDVKISLATDQKVVISINGLALLFFGLFPASLIQLCISAFAG